LWYSTLSAEEEHQARSWDVEGQLVSRREMLSNKKALLGKKSCSFDGDGDIRAAANQAAG
jgi:hypothetical protein